MEHSARPRGGRTVVRKSPAKPSGESAVTHGYFRSFDGTKLFYSIEGKGPPLVFCYGLICSSLHWTYQIEYFRHHYQTIWMDYRGHHNSDFPKDPSSLNLEAIAKDLDCLLDELKIPKAVLMGHSMGVNVVLEFYRQQPQRFLGMVLANGTSRNPFDTLLGGNFTKPGFKALSALYNLSPSITKAAWKLAEKNPIGRTLVTLAGFNPHLTAPEDIELYLHHVHMTDPGIFLRLSQDYQNRVSTSWLHTVQTPTLIIAGENDHVVPVSEQKLLHQLIPQAELEVIKHGSHCPQMDLPDLVNMKIERWLESLGY